MNSFNSRILGATIISNFDFTLHSIKLEHLVKEAYFLEVVMDALDTKWAFWMSIIVLMPHHNFIIHVKHLPFVSNHFPVFLPLLIINVWSHLLNFLLLLLIGSL